MIETLMNAMNATGSEWVLWLLFVLSAVSLGIVIERVIFLRRRRVDVEALSKKVGELLDGGKTSEALVICRESPAMEARVGARVLENLHRSPEGLEDLYKATVERERLDYERFIGFLATLGSNAPFIGLFGTVLGIVGAFAQLSSSGSGAGRGSVIMGSISEALVATAVGLLVAIPAVVAYNGFQKRIDRSIGGAEVIFRELLARARQR